MEEYLRGRGCGRGRGRGIFPHVATEEPRGRAFGNVPEENQSNNVITAQDRLDFLSLEGGRTFVMPSSSTGGMGLVLPRYQDTNDQFRRQRDQEYYKPYLEMEKEDLIRMRDGKSNSNTPLPQSLSLTSDISQNTQRSQFDEVEELSTIGGLASMKELSQEEYRALYTRYSRCFRAGRFNSTLIISASKEKIVKSINTRDVVIISSSTGSGKTTQVPQYILDYHSQRKTPCRIVVTQPRRIAATSVARRVAEEMGVQLGTLVGYQIGMDKQASPDTCITYMTTGVLLQKLINQKNMNDYTHVIIDEIHERDQETDFLMLVVKKFLRSNSKTTKVILMSATIDVEIYQNYFGRVSRDGIEPASVLNLEGKPHSVIEYHLDSLSQLGDLPELDLLDPRMAPECYYIAYQLIRSFDRLEAIDLNSKSSNKGTVLVFLPGFEHIVQMRKQLQADNIHDIKKWWILPLHSSITKEEQSNVFKLPQPNFRKIILSTNIAESSITVTDIKYVIDFCLTKVLCRDNKTNYVSLQLEWAAKASCEQRRGRAGRVDTGRVYRLVPYSLYHKFKNYQTPEMKRCPLELVILKAKRMDMGEPKAVLALALDHPDIYDIEKSILTLKEVGALALTSNGFYTPYDGDMTFIGHVMSALPLDAKISKFILLGHVFDCLEDCIIIAACLSVMNFFSKPFDKKLESYKAKLAWASNTFSDCFAFWEAYLMWTRLLTMKYFHGPGHVNEAQWAKTNYVELNRLNEVKFLVEEIKKRLDPMGIRLNQRHKNAPRAGEEESKDDKIFILSVCLCGAFYPNYFIQAEIDEKLVYRELSKKNPLNTVYLTSLPNDQGILYERQILRLFEDVSDTIRIDFEGSKALVNFGNPTTTPNASNDVSKAVYLALKLKQEGFNFEINLIHPDDAAQKMKRIEQKRNDHFLKNKIMANNRISSMPDVMRIKKSCLPSMRQLAIKIIIMNIKDCGNFWAQYKDEINQQQISHILHAINVGEESDLKRVGDYLEIGSLVFAPYPLGGEIKYYRAYVESLVERGNKEKTYSIFFVDYGFTLDLPISKLRQFDVDLDESLLEIPTQAIRCRLACIRPAFHLNSKPGEWSTKAVLFFHKMVDDKDLIARVYSVVDGCVNLDLFRREPDGQEISINKELIRKGFAEDCEEDYLSKENHKLRQVFEQMSEAQQETFSSQQNMDDDFLHVNLHDIQNTRSEIIGYKKLRLRGPFSPLESSFFGLSKVSCCKRVRIERDSINSITLDPEPHNRHSRMLVASYVSLSGQGDVMNVRNTTLMPHIHGLPALMMLLFSPAIELRINAQKSKYIGAICGLGYQAETCRSYYPDHDSEIEFDTVIDREDFLEINFIRTCINLVLGDAEKYLVTDTSSDVYFDDIRKKAKKHIQKLLSKPRKSQDRMPAREPYAWGTIPKEDLITIDFDDNGTVKLLPMHKAVYLKTMENEDYAAKLENLKHLRQRAKNTDVPELNKCSLCDITTLTPLCLLEHLNDPSHIRNEYYLKKECISTEEE